MSILDYSKLPLVHIIISQQLSSFIDYSLGWKLDIYGKYIKYSIYNKLRSQKVIQKSLTRNGLVWTIN